MFKNRWPGVQAPFSCDDILDKSIVDMMDWCGVSDVQGAYCMHTELPESD